MRLNAFLPPHHLDPNLKGVVRSNPETREMGLIFSSTAEPAIGSMRDGENTVSVEELNFTVMN